MLYVQNTVGRDIAVVDEADDWKVVDRISLGDGIRPDALCSSPDGAVLYANGTLVHDQEKLRHGPLERESSTLVAFDTQTNGELWRVRFKGRVGHLDISRDGRYVYSALYDTPHVARIDTRAQEVSFIKVYFIGGHGVRVSADAQWVYVGSILWAEIDVIDALKGETVDRLHFPENVRPFVITPDRKTAYVQVSRLHGFHVMDLDRKEIVRTVPMPGPTVAMEAKPHTADHGLEMSADGTRLFALATTLHEMVVYALPDLQVTDRLPTGTEPSWVIVDRSRDLVYVSNRGSDDVSVISARDLEEIKRFKAGRYPQRMCATG